jgi:hypothetical protein
MGSKRVTAAVRPDPKDVAAALGRGRVAEEARLGNRSARRHAAPPEMGLVRIAARY